MRRLGRPTAVVSAEPPVSARFLPRGPPVGCGAPGWQSPMPVRTVGVSRPRVHLSACSVSGQSLCHVPCGPLSVSTSGPAGGRPWSLPHLAALVCTPRGDGRASVGLAHLGALRSSDTLTYPASSGGPAGAALRHLSSFWVFFHGGLWRQGSSVVQRLKDGLASFHRV